VFDDDDDDDDDTLRAATSAKKVGISLPNAATALINTSAVGPRRSFDRSLEIAFCPDNPPRAAISFCVRPARCASA